MPEHTHSYVWDNMDGSPPLYCDICHVSISWEELRRRAHATDKLSVKDALDAAFAINEKKMLTAVVKNLESYAATLERNDA